MNIYTINKTTLIDYPGHLAASVYTGGCNMRCIYCHNAPLVTGVASLETISEDEFFAFLDKRKNILHGVCISGGEPTLSPDLPQFIDRIRSYGLKIKLDTNGTDPDIIRDLISSEKIDMIAMDIKSYPEDYPRICDCAVSIDDIKRSAGIIMDSPIDYEFRTTVPRGIFTADHMMKIGQWLQGAKAYFLQAFKEADTCMTQGLEEPLKEELEVLLSALLPYIPSAKIRGID